MSTSIPINHSTTIAYTATEEENSFPKNRSSFLSHETVDSLPFILDPDIDNLMACEYILDDGMLISVHESVGNFEVVGQ